MGVTTQIEVDYTLIELSLLTFGLHRYLFGNLLLKPKIPLHQLDCLFLAPLSILLDPLHKLFCRGAVTLFTDKFKCNQHYGCQRCHHQQFNHNHEPKRTNRRHLDPPSATASSSIPIPISISISIPISLSFASSPTPSAVPCGNSAFILSSVASTSSSINSE